LIPCFAEYANAGFLNGIYGKFHNAPMKQFSAVAKNTLTLFRRRQFNYKPALGGDTFNLSLKT